MISNVLNLDWSSYWTEYKELTIENSDALFQELLENLELWAQEAIKWLTTFLKDYGETSFCLFINWLYQDGIEKMTIANMTVSKKAIIFRLVHIAFYKNKMKPSTYLLYAMHLANISQDSNVIQGMQNDLNTSLSLEQKQKLVTLGQELIKAWWMTQWELDLIEIQLITNQKQQELIFY